MDLMARRRAIMGMPSGKDYTVSGNVVSISNALAKNAKSAIVTFLPKQSGSGDPSPNNVRPISGYNDISAVRYGKNLLGGSALKADLLANISKATDGGNDIVNVGTLGNGSLAFSDFKENTRYTLLLDILPTGTYIGGAVNYADGTATYFGAGMVAGERTLIVYTSSANKTVTSIRISNGAPAYTVYCNTSGIFVGNVDASAFEPYISPVTANVHSDTTLYGGTVDLVSGECVVDRAIVDLGTLSWYYVTTGTYPFFESGTITGANKDKGCVCSAYKGIMAQNGTYWRDGTHPQEIGFNKSGGSPYTRVQDSNYTDATSFKSAVSGVILCYELATPITYYLTPSQLAMLKGNNTVYSNEGSILLTYVGK